ncbi:hypothetical protein GQX74_012294 [Glossina fuscipes]|nr:hypothetical protein GQX74_012294 [Glossina fuscipes]
MCGGYRDAGIGVAEAENVGKIISGIVCIFNGFACNCVAVYLAANTSRHHYKKRSLMTTEPIKSKGSKKFYSVQSNVNNNFLLLIGKQLGPINEDVYLQDAAFVRSVRILGRYVSILLHCLQSLLSAKMLALKN